MISKYYKYIFFLLVGVVLAFSLQACRDNSLDNESFVFSGEATPVVFRISNTNALMGFGSVSSSTRAVDETKEGDMSNLYIVAVKTADWVENSDGSSGRFVNRNNGEEYILITDLYSVGTSFQPGGEPRDYNIDLYPGKYKFYVLANFDMYLSRFGSVGNFQTLEDFRTINLNFQANNPLEPGHLPMACLPSQIECDKITEKDSRPDVEEVYKDDIIVTIKDKSQYQASGEEWPVITADMRFLCSKVRYTILYNNTKGGCSEAFGSQSIRFNVDHNQFTVASNLRNKTYLNSHAWTANEKDSVIMTTKDVYQAYPDGTENDQFNRAYWSIELGRYQFKDGVSFNEDYPEKPHYDDNPIEPFPGTTGDWLKTNQRVWQGICYLPENNDIWADHTLLAFPYVYDKTVDGQVVQGVWDNSKFKTIWLFGDNTEEKHYPGTPADSMSGESYSSEEETEENHGIKRGMMYDVVAKVVTPENLEMDVQVYVNVLAWTHHTPTDGPAW